NHSRRSGGNGDPHRVRQRRAAPGRLRDSYRRCGTRYSVCHHGAGGRRRGARDRGADQRQGRRRCVAGAAQDAARGGAVTPAFGARLVAATAARGPLCAGIDPHPALLDNWGYDRDPAGLERFALRATEVLAPRVAVVKPQSALFEAHGAAGMGVLQRVIEHARAAGALVLLDVKRGDIGSTMAGYAAAYLDAGGALAVDAITVSPYLGFGS